MSSHTPNITALTNDYDAIERAIRETSRGRWFLHCYLERNRSAETRMLLDAIARLEGAMRESGHAIEAIAPAEAVTRVAEAIGEARSDIAHMVTSNGPTVPLPLPRFSFGSIPRSAAASAQAIRDAAESVEAAARALRDAGVFHGIARQLTEKSDEILRACNVQDNAICQMDRLADAISEIEAEIMAVMDNRTTIEEDGRASAALQVLRRFSESDARSIPEGVMKELSLALAGTKPLDEPTAPNDDPLPPISA
jgi:hypothetical protein